MIIMILGVVVLITLLVWIAYQTKVVREEALMNLLEKRIQIYTACAGSDDENKIIPSYREIQSLEYNVFKDQNGNILNINDYLHFIVQGESMQFCGIHNNDVIFVDEKFKFEEDTKFPIILVLRKHHLNREDKAQYKIRRTWMRCKYTSKEELVDIVKSKILPSTKFQEIRQLSTYDGDSALIQDLKDKRIKIYEEKYIKCENPNDNDKEIIISTTFHTKEKEIRFSLHPVSIIVGQVIASFPINDNNK
nr:hypothetical protein AUSP0019_00154 [uncultured phage]